MQALNALLPGVNPISMFMCLTDQQQRTLALFSNSSEDALAALSNAEFLD